MRITFYGCLLCVALLSACSSAPIRDLGLDKLAPGKAEQDLSAGLRAYEDGQYKAASKSLQAALDAGLAFKTDQVRAHKYLAFIYCISEQERQCREEFKKAYALDAKFELEPAEAGHPIWGPVYRSVRAEHTRKTR